MSKHSGKKFLAFALSLVLVVGLMPAPPAHADQGLQAAGVGVSATETLAPQADSDVSIVNSLSMEKGETKTLSIKNAPSGAIYWSSTNTDVASVSIVNNQPKVKAHKTGKAIIICRFGSTNKRYGVELTVTDGSAPYLNKTKLSLQVGNKTKLKLKKAKASKVSWKSKNKKVATVSKRGVVKAKKAGKTKIIAKYKGKKYKCKVTVEPGEVTMVKLKKGKTTVTASKKKSVTVGSLKKDGYKVKIPKGAFSKKTKVTVKVKNGKLSLKAKGNKHVRLNKPVKIQFALTGPVAEGDIDNWRGLYYLGSGYDYIDPDIKKLRKGVLQYKTYHFSKFGGKALSDTELRTLAAYRDAVNEISKDCQNELAQSFVESCFGGAMDALGYEQDDSGREKVMKQLGKSADFFALVRAASSGDEATFASKATELLAKTVIENADGTKVGYLGAAVGSVPAALQQVRSGNYNGALAEVSKAVTGNIPYVKAVQFAASITESTIDYYVDSETEAAYKLYYNKLKDGDYGYSTAHSVAWDRVEQQMAGPLRQMNDRAIKAYAAAHGKSVSSLSKAEQDKVRAVVKNNLIKQFEHRAANEAKIDARQAETTALLEEFEKQGLMKRGDESVGFGKNDDAELRLSRLLRLRDNISDIMGGKTYADLMGYGTNMLGSEANVRAYNREKMAELVTLWVENAWIYGGNAVAGRQAVARHLAEETGLGVKMNPSGTYDMTVGDKQTFRLNGAYSAPSWTSSNAKVASVSAAGEVKALAPGKATITAQYGKFSYSCTVSVESSEQYALSSTSITLTSSSFAWYVTLDKIVNGDWNNPIQIDVGGSAFRVIGDPVVTYWYDADHGLAVRALDGVAGSVTITCTYEGVDYTCEVTVDTR